MSVNLRRFEAAATILDINPKVADLRPPTHTRRCYRVSSGDIMSRNRSRTKEALCLAFAVLAPLT